VDIVIDPDKGFWRGEFMNGTTEEIIDLLVKSISSINEVRSIGISGSSASFPKAGEGDIDIFIYCDSVPEAGKRQCALNKLGGLLKDCRTAAFSGGHWGTGDFVLVNGVETWLMYFTEKETLKEIEDTLGGAYPDKPDNYYYPIGRCAMLKNINILYDADGFLHSLKKRLAEYPEKLKETLVEYHMAKLADTEDLERAVTRKDVLFYHFALDMAIDHFLQAFFALNRTYFPSRKRTLDFIVKFETKPEGCGEKLLEVVKLGSQPDGISKSYAVFRALTDDLKKISGK
jgi:hypothetical protein